MDVENWSFLKYEEPAYIFMVIVGLKNKGKGCKDKEVSGGKQEGHGREEGEGKK